MSQPVVQQIETEQEKQARLRAEAVARANKHASTYSAARDAPNDPWFATDVANPYKDDVRHKNPYYAQIAYHSGMPLRGYTDPKDPNKTIERRLHYGDGAEELMRIVAGLQKGVRQVNGTQTWRGAQDWITRNRKEHWEAIEADFTGPQGRPDGIPEVVVTDAKGNVRIVNGYALGPSSYGWRRAYYGQYPDKTSQMKHGYGDFKERYKQFARGLDGKGNFAYRYVLNGKIAKIRGKISARNLYRQIFFTPTYKQFSAGIKKELSAMAKSQISSSIFKYVYTILFLYPAMIAKNGQLTEENIVNMDPKEFEKIKKSTSVRERINDDMKAILSRKAEQIKLFILTAHLIAVCFKENYNITFTPTSTIYNIQMSDLLNYAAIAQFVQDANNLSATDQYVKAIETARDTAFKSRTDAHEAAATTRINKLNTSARLYKQYPPYYKDVAQGMLDAGWQYYRGVNPQGTDLYKPWRDKYNEYINPQQPQRQPSAAAQQVLNQMHSPQAQAAYTQSQLAINNPYARRTPVPSFSNLPRHPFGQGTTAFGTTRTTGAAPSVQTPTIQTPTVDEAQIEQNAEQVADEHGMPIVEETNGDEPSKIEETTILADSEPNVEDAPQ